MATTKDKGNILEQIVAWLHEDHDVVVERNVWLPMLGSTFKREIDILISTRVEGYPVQLVVECKNEHGRIGPTKIDAFRGKLEAVGIPPSQGIHVSANGYTECALETARMAGIKTLAFDGLSADRLSLEVSKAFKSVVVLLPDVVRVWSDKGASEAIEDINEAFLFYDIEGHPVGTVQDFVWQAWQAGDLKAEVGTTTLMLELPEGWHNVIAGQKRAVHHVSVQVEILGLVMTDEGEARESKLVATDGGETVRYGISAHFGSASERYRLVIFNSEDQVQEFFAAHGRVHLVHRIRSPRIRFWNMMFWPPSQRVADIIAVQLRLFEESRIPDPRPFSFQQLEGSDLSAAWEPIAGDYLAGLTQSERVEVWRAT